MLNKFAQEDPACRAEPEQKLSGPEPSSPFPLKPFPQTKMRPTSLFAVSQSKQMLHFFKTEEERVSFEEWLQTKGYSTSPRAGLPLLPPESLPYALVYFRLERMARRLDEVENGSK